MNAVGGGAAVDGPAVDGAAVGAPGELTAGAAEADTDGVVADDVDLLRSSRAMTIAPTAMITAHTTAVIGHRYLLMSPPLDHY